MAKPAAIFGFLLILMFVSAPAFTGANAEKHLEDNCPFLAHNALPQEALDLLAGAKESSCPECIKINRRKAISLLNQALRPGKIFCLRQDSPVLLDVRTPSLLVLKSGPVPDGYPKIALQFHTEKRHWPGVKQQDFTNPGTAALLEGQAGNYCFAGRFALVACPYGDGDAFYYDSTAHSLVLHIRFLELDPASCP